MFAMLNRSNRWFMLANFLFALSYGLWMNLRPLYLGRLGASPEQVGTVLGLVALAGGVLPIPAGLLTDRFGPKRIIVAAWLLACLGTAIAALASTWAMAGVGFAVFMLVIAANPATAALVLHHAGASAGPGQASRIMAIVFASWPAAMIFAPVLGGVLAEQWGIQAVLVLAALILLAAVGALMQTRDAHPQRLAERPPARDLLHNRRFLVMAVFFPLVMLAANLGYVLAPTFLETSRGLSLAVIGLLFSLFSVGTLGFNAMVGRIRLPLYIGVLMMALIAAMFLLWQFDQTWVAGASFVLMGAISTLWVVAQTSYGQAVPAAQRGIALGITETLAYIAIAAASWLAGQLFERTLSHELPLVASLALLTVLLAVWAFLPRLRRLVSSVPAAAPSAPVVVAEAAN